MITLTRHAALIAFANCAALSANAQTSRPQNAEFVIERPARRGIDLVYYHGKSVKEAAEIVGVAEATVKTRMFCARKALAGLVATA
jgi:predicted DNA-binding protein (UPF0251 family)